MEQYTTTTTVDSTFFETFLTLLPLLILLSVAIPVVYAVIKLFKAIIRYLDAKTEYYKRAGRT